mgnify:CR=1 FL=1
MELIHYKPEQLANELYSVSKEYHQEKVLLTKYERERKTIIAQEYKKYRANGMSGKDAEMEALASIKVKDLDSKIYLTDVKCKELYSAYEAKQVEIDLIRSHNSTTKEELKLAQINENVIRRSNG